MVHETALIKKCQRGDRQAFDDLIRLYYDYIFGFLLKSTMDKDLTEDLTQETFLKMIRNIERFDPDGRVGFGTWLVTIAKNSYIDHLRRNHIFLENIRGFLCRTARTLPVQWNRSSSIRNCRLRSTPCRRSRGWRSG